MAIIYVIVAIAIGLLSITILGFQAVVANPCPPGQIPVIDPNGGIKTDPSTGNILCTNP